MGSDPPSKPRFEDCYPEIDRQVRAAARVYGGGLERADVVQESLTRIALKWSEYDPSKNLKGWAWQFTRRVCADFRGRPSRREISSDDGSLEEADESPDPEKRAEYAERYGFLIELLRPMDEDRRIVFVLKELDEFTGREIAEMLSIPLDTVFSRLRAARAELEERLARRRKSSGPAALPAVVTVDALLQSVAHHRALLDVDTLDLDAPGGAPLPAKGPTGGGNGAAPASGALPAGGPPPAAPAAGALAKAVPTSAMRLASHAIVVFALGAGAGAVGHAWLGEPAPARGAVPLAADAVKAGGAPAETAAPRETAMPENTGSPAATTSSSPPASSTGALKGPVAGNAAKPLPAPTETTSAAPSASAIASAAPAVTAAPTVTVYVMASAAPSAGIATAPDSAPNSDRLLIDKAGIALQNGDLAVAREALQRHAREFPASKWAGRRQELLDQLRQLEAKQKQ
jgi:RNA polymerase sigma-70 factor (ECF subfamily)